MTASSVVRNDNANTLHRSFPRFAWRPSIRIERPRGWPRWGRASWVEQCCVTHFSLSTAWRRSQQEDTAVEPRRNPRVPNFPGSPRRKASTTEQSPAAFACAQPVPGQAACEGRQHNTDILCHACTPDRGAILGQQAGPRQFSVQERR